MNKIKKVPLVSVLMPVYNSKFFIKQAIESILTQTYANLELIIVDDHSTDGTWTIIRSLAKENKKIKAIRLKINSGTTVATNTAFMHASGEYIAIMDSDDISLHDRIRQQVAFLEEHPKTIVVGTQATVINQNGQIIGSKIFPTKHAEIYKQYGIVHPIVHPSIMIRRSLLPHTDILYLDKYDIHADYYNMFHLLQFGKFANLDKELLLYRIHGNNNSLKKLKRSYWQILKIRIEAIFSFNYRISPLAFILMLAQTTVALSTPEFLLKWMYLKVKGFQNVTI